MQYFINYSGLKIVQVGDGLFLRVLDGEHLSSILDSDVRGFAESNYKEQKLSYDQQIFK